MAVPDRFQEAGIRYRDGLRAAMLAGDVRDRTVLHPFAVDPVVAGSTKAFQMDDSVSRVSLVIRRASILLREDSVLGD
ncbi:MAG: hypothetical protein WBG92_18405, partial [Thiohalocapsa sp.]